MRPRERPIAAISSSLMPETRNLRKPPPPSGMPSAAYRAPASSRAESTSCCRTSSTGQLRGDGQNSVADGLQRGTERLGHRPDDSFRVMPRYWIWLQILIIVFVLVAGMVIAITKLAWGGSDWAAPRGAVRRSIGCDRRRRLAASSSPPSVLGVRPGGAQGLRGLLQSRKDLLRRRGGAEDPAGDDQRRSGRHLRRRHRRAVDPTRVTEPVRMAGAEERHLVDRRQQRPG